MVPFQPGVRLLCLCLLSATAWGAGVPKAIAHRGGSALRPENTIAAFRHALALGVPVLEFDMNVTADGAIVVHHDSTVHAGICKAPDVKAGPIALLTLAQIKQFDCGSFARAASPHFQSAPGERMPTLDEFFEAVKASDATLLGETKIPAPGAPSPVSPERFGEMIHEAVARHGLADRFILQSSDYRTLDSIRKKNSKIGICLLNARRFRPAYLQLARRHGATHLMLRADDVTPEQIAELRAAGLKLFSGTANSETEWKKYLELGMDGILTDDPRGLLQFLNNQ